jgi:ribosomal protein L5
MEEPKLDQVTLDMFTSQSLERHTKRLIAGILSDMESFTGVKDKRRSQTVKDIANYAKRAMLTKLTGLEVEPIHADSSERSPVEEPPA